MDLSLSLFRESNADAWKFVLFTDMGKDGHGRHPRARPHVDAARNSAQGSSRKSNTP